MSETTTVNETESELPALPKRSEVPVELTWDTTTIYPSNEAWEAEFARLQSELPKLASFQGRLRRSGKTLLAALQADDEVSGSVERLHLYASMRMHEDEGESKYQAMADRSETLATQYQAAAAFLEPEILSIPEQRLDGWIQKVPGLRVYQHYFDDLNRQRPHVRNAEVEELLAEMGELSQIPQNVYGKYCNADMKLPLVLDAAGKPVPLTKGNFVARFLQSNDRGERERAFQIMFDTYKAVCNMLASTYAGQVKNDIVMSRARRYSNSMEYVLADANIPVAVYDNLIQTVNAGLSKLHRYLELRKRLLGLSDLRWWDLYVPLVPELDYKVSYPEAQKIVLAGLKPLGEEYLKTLAKGFNSRWVDVVENEGKHSGAYSWGTHDTNPFILLNWTDSMESLFTLAHEAGHSMHSFYTHKAQSHRYSDYPIFMAEVASITNETLLHHHLLGTTDDRALRLYLINHALEEMRTTLFRQTMFAEFERETHRQAENGQALTADLLSEIYLGLNQKYYGPVSTIDELVGIEWARIPHFYTPFYVYTYGTGLSSAVALSKQILEEGEPAVKRYLRFLSSGSSDYSINLLRDAGVDYSTGRPIQEALDAFDDYLDQFEEAIAGK